MNRLDESLYCMFVFVYEFVYEFVYVYVCVYVCVFVSLIIYRHCGKSSLPQWILNGINNVVLLVVF